MTRKNGIKILKVAHHRNGMLGNSFHVVTFKNYDLTMVGIVFDKPEPYNFDKKVAILNIDLLSQGIIEFGENSWRGDEFADDLYKAVEEYEKNR
jgi:hypothetical protein